MAQFLNAYKVIGKKHYKVGLKRAYRKYLKYVYDEKGNLRKGIIAKTVAPDFESFAENIVSRANKDIAERNKQLRDLGRKEKKLYTRRTIRFTKKDLSDILKSTKYRSDLSTAKKFLEKIQDYDDETEYTIHQLRKMETSEIAKILAGDIKKDYHKIMADLGKGHSKEASAKIAEMYFGS